MSYLQTTIISPGFWGLPCCLGVLQGCLVHCQPLLQGVLEAAGGCRRDFYFLLRVWDQNNLRSSWKHLVKGRNDSLCKTCWHKQHIFQFLSIYILTLIICLKFDVRKFITRNEVRLTRRNENNLPQLHLVNRSWSRASWTTVFCVKV